MALGPQFEQVQLFMTGTELQSKITNSIDRVPGGSMEGLWKRKLRESKRTGMEHGADTYKSLQQHGWQSDPESPRQGPGIMHVRKFGAIPEFDRDEMSVDDAHHRIAAAADLERKGKRTIYIPTWDRYEYPSLRPDGR